MLRIINLLFVLAVLGFVALVGYAYFGVTPPLPQDVTKPVTLDAD